MTVVQGMPFSSHNIPPINIPGYQLPPPNVQQLPILYAATPAYLAMMGVSLVKGRLFDDGEVVHHCAVTIDRLRPHACARAHEVSGAYLRHQSL